MKTELEKYQEALEALGCRFNAIAGLMDRTAAEREIESILNPPPELEDVPVVRWECGVCGHVHRSEPKICNGAVGDGWCNEKGRFIKLTGAIQRPKPQPMQFVAKVRWSEVNTNVYPVSVGETKDWKPLIGKTGTLVWQEDPK